jgi:hypothetical protein
MRPLRSNKKTSLLAAPIKCKEAPPIARKSAALRAHRRHAALRPSLQFRCCPGAASPRPSTRFGDQFRYWSGVPQNKTRPFRARAGATSLRVDASRRFLYDELELVGRLAQRLERSVYTRKVVRSNRTVPTTVTLQPFSGDVVQLVRTLPCHGRGREFESRRPRHSFQKSCTNFAATNEGAKGHVFAPFLHPFSSIRAVFTSSAFTGLTTLTRVRWSSFQERRPAQGPLLAQRVLLARLPACKHPAWTVTRNAAATPASL